MGNEPTIEEAQKSQDDIEKLEGSIDKFILKREEEIRDFFGNYNGEKINLFKFNLNDEGLTDLQKLKNLGKIEYSIIMKYDADELISKNKEPYELCNIEICNIGALLSQNGLIHRILVFYTFFLKILNGKQNANRDIILKEINRALKAIINNDIGFFHTFYKMKLTNNFLYFLKSAYYKIKSWFKTPLGESLCDIFKSFTNKGLAIICSLGLALPGLISIPFLCVVGLITLITYVGFNFVNNKKKQINEYLKKKNRVNLSIILKKIYDIFVEEKYKDFFEKNNIYIFAYDANIIWHKNAGATFFGKYFPFDPPGVDGGKNDIR